MRSHAGGGRPQSPKISWRINAPRVARAVLALAVAAVCAGCGPGPGAGTADVGLRVTENFGTSTIKSLAIGKVTGAETDMQLLEHHFTVKTRYGGGFVESVDGHSGSSDDHDWFFYVDGVQSKQGAAEVDVHHGDDVWWDLHDWKATDSIPAVVGSFPDPFLSGIGGRRYPTTLECGAGLTQACDTVTHELKGLNVTTSPQAIGTGSGPATLRIVLGTWTQVQGEAAARLIAHGPGTSGVYARFSDQGDELELLNQDGRVARTLGAGTGLIAATSAQSPVPTWLITGTDPAGVAAAAKALRASALDGKFAAVVHGSQVLNVPLT